MSATTLPGRRVTAAAVAGLLLTLTSPVTPARAAATTGQIAGSLLDAGRPVAGATVEAAYVQTPAASAAKAVTDAAGNFQITGVPAGKWLLHTTLPGGWMTQYYPATTDTAKTAVPITVTAGQTAQVDETVMAHAALEGRITLNSGAPAAGAIVTMPHRLTIQTRAGADGDYLLDYLTPGDHSFTVRAGDYAPEQPMAQSLHLVAGERTHHDETLLPLGRITGQYSDAAGPIYATVVAYAGGVATVQAVTSAADGSFTMWVTPGDYTLRFDSINDNRDQWATASLTESGAEVFTVREDQIVRHDERTIAAGTLKGRVLDYAGVPFEKPSEVTIFDSAGWIRSQLTTDSAGYWSAQVAPDTYKVQFSNGYYEYAHNQPDIEHADQYPVGSGTTTTVPDELMLPHTDLFVYAAVAGTAVTAFCATAATERLCTENGEVWFSDVYPGDYQVTVEAPGRAPATGNVTVADRTYATVTVPLASSVR